CTQPATEGEKAGDVAQIAAQFPGQEDSAHALGRLSCLHTPGAARLPRDYASDWLRPTGAAAQIERPQSVWVAAPSPQPTPPKLAWRSATWFQTPPYPDPSERAERYPGRYDQ